MKAANKLVKDRKKGTSSTPQQKAGSAAKNADAGRKTGTRYKIDLYSLIEHLIECILSNLIDVTVTS